MGCGYEGHFLYTNIPKQQSTFLLAPALESICLSPQSDLPKMEDTFMYVHLLLGLLRHTCYRTS